MTDYTIQPQVKIIDLIKANEKSQAACNISFEFFPPKTEVGDEKLKQALVEFAKQSPVFIDVTWGAGGTTHEKTTEICAMAKRMGFVVSMHLTCTGCDEKLVDQGLIFCLNNGIRNIVALRGDPPAGQTEWKATEGGFSCARDLIKHIRRYYGDYFSICCAGYPEGHPDKLKADHNEGKITDEEMASELKYLKEKCDAGADYIITQLFYDNQMFLNFVKKCREAGITIPIIPGLLPMLTYAGFNRMTSLCKTYVPAELKAKVEALKGASDEDFRAFGVELTTNMCRELLANGVKHLHFYTLNQLPSTLEVMKNLNLLKQ